MWFIFCCIGLNLHKWYKIRSNIFPSDLWIVFLLRNPVFFSSVHVCMCDGLYTRFNVSKLWIHSHEALTFTCRKAGSHTGIAWEPPQVKNIRTKELGSDHLQFRELFLYSLDITDLKHGDVQWGKKAPLYVFIYDFSHSFDCLFCRGVGKQSSLHS